MADDPALQGPPPDDAVLELADRALWRASAPAQPGSGSDAGEQWQPDNLRAMAEWPALRQVGGGDEGPLTETQRESMDFLAFLHGRSAGFLDDLLSPDDAGLADAYGPLDMPFAFWDDEWEDDDLAVVEDGDGGPIVRRWPFMGTQRQTTARPTERRPAASGPQAAATRPRQQQRTPRIGDSVLARHTLVSPRALIAEPQALALPRAGAADAAPADWSLPDLVHVAELPPETVAVDDGPLQVADRWPAARMPEPTPPPAPLQAAPLIAAPPTGVPTPPTPTSAVQRNEAVAPAAAPVAGAPQSPPVAVPGAVSAAGPAPVVPGVSPSAPVQPAPQAAPLAPAAASPNDGSAATARPPAESAAPNAADSAAPRTAPAAAGQSAGPSAAGSSTTSPSGAAPTNTPVTPVSGVPAAPAGGSAGGIAQPVDANPSLQREAVAGTDPAMGPATIAPAAGQSGTPGRAAADQPVDAGPPVPAAPSLLAAAPQPAVPPSAPGEAAPTGVPAPLPPAGTAMQADTAAAAPQAAAGSPAPASAALATTGAALPPAADGGPTADTADLSPTAPSAATTPVASTAQNASPAVGPDAAVPSVPGAAPNGGGLPLVSAPASGATSNPLASGAGDATAPAGAAASVADSPVPGLVDGSPAVRPMVNGGRPGRGRTPQTPAALETVRLTLDWVVGSDPWAAPRALGAVAPLVQALAEQGIRLVVERGRALGPQHYEADFAQPAAAFSLTTSLGAVPLGSLDVLAGAVLVAGRPGELRVVVAPQAAAAVQREASPLAFVSDTSAEADAAAAFDPADVVATGPTRPRPLPFTPEAASLVRPAEPLTTLQRQAAADLASMRSLLAAQTAPVAASTPGGGLVAPAALQPTQAAPASATPAAAPVDMPFVAEPTPVDITSDGAAEAPASSDASLRPSVAAGLQPQAVVSSPMPAAAPQPAPAPPNPGDTPAPTAVAGTQAAAPAAGPDTPPPAPLVAALPPAAVTQPTAAAPAPVHPVVGPANVAASAPATAAAPEPGVPTAPPATSAQPMGDPGTPPAAASPFTPIAPAATPAGAPQAATSDTAATPPMATAPVAPSASPLQDESAPGAGLPSPAAGTGAAAASALDAQPMGVIGGANTPASEGSAASAPDAPAVQPQRASGGLPTSAASPAPGAAPLVTGPLGAQPAAALPEAAVNVPAPAMAPEAPAVSESAPGDSVVPGALPAAEAVAPRTTESAPIAADAPLQAAAAGEAAPGVGAPLAATEDSDVVAAGPLSAPPAAAAVTRPAALDPGGYPHRVTVVVDWVAGQGQWALGEALTQAQAAADLLLSEGIMVQVVPGRAVAAEQYGAGEALRAADFSAWGPRGPVMLADLPILEGAVLVSDRPGALHVVASPAAPHPAGPPAAATAAGYDAFDWALPEPDQQPADAPDGQGAAPTAWRTADLSPSLSISRPQAPSPITTWTPQPPAAPAAQPTTAAAPPPAATPIAPPVGSAPGSVAASTALPGVPASPAVAGASPTPALQREPVPAAPMDLTLAAAPTAPAEPPVLGAPAGVPAPLPSAPAGSVPDSESTGVANTDTSAPPPLTLAGDAASPAAGPAIPVPPAGGDATTETPGLAAAAAVAGPSSVADGTPADPEGDHAATPVADAPPPYLTAAELLAPAGAQPLSSTEGLPLVPPLETPARDLWRAVQPLSADDGGPVAAAGRMAPFPLDGDPLTFVAEPVSTGDASVVEADAVGQTPGRVAARRRDETAPAPTSTQTPPASQPLPSAALPSPQGAPTTPSAAGVVSSDSAAPAPTPTAGGTPAITPPAAPAPSGIPATAAPAGAAPAGDAAAPAGSGTAAATPGAPAAPVAEAAATSGPAGVVEGTTAQRQVAPIDGAATPPAVATGGRDAAAASAANPDDAPAHTGAPGSAMPSAPQATAGGATDAFSVAGAPTPVSAQRVEAGDLPSGGVEGDAAAESRGLSGPQPLAGAPSLGSTVGWLTGAAQPLAAADATARLAELLGGQQPIADDGGSFAARLDGVVGDEFALPPFVTDPASPEAEAADGAAVATPRSSASPLAPVEPRVEAAALPAVQPRTAEPVPLAAASAGEQSGVAPAPSSSAVSGPIGAPPASPVAGAPPLGVPSIGAVTPAAAGSAPSAPRSTDSSTGTTPTGVPGVAAASVPGGPASPAGGRPVPLTPVRVTLDWVAGADPWQQPGVLEQAAAAAEQLASYGVRLEFVRGREVSPSIAAAAAAAMGAPEPLVVLGPHGPVPLQGVPLLVGANLVTQRPGALQVRVSAQAVRAAAGGRGAGAAPALPDVAMPLVAAGEPATVRVALDWVAGRDPWAAGATPEVPPAVAQRLAAQGVRLEVVRGREVSPAAYNAAVAMATSGPAVTLPQGTVPLNDIPWLAAAVQLAQAPGGVRFVVDPRSPAPFGPTGAAPIAPAARPTPPLEFAQPGGTPVNPADAAQPFAGGQLPLAGDGTGRNAVGAADGMRSAEEAPNLRQAGAPAASDTPLAGAPVLGRTPADAPPRGRAMEPLPPLVGAPLTPAGQPFEPLVNPSVLTPAARQLSQALGLPAATPDALTRELARLLPNQATEQVLAPLARLLAQQIAEEEAGLAGGPAVGQPARSTFEAYPDGPSTLNVFVYEAPFDGGPGQPASGPVVRQASTEVSGPSMPVVQRQAASSASAGAPPSTYTDQQALVFVEPDVQPLPLRVEEVARAVVDRQSALSRNGSTPPSVTTSEMVAPPDEHGVRPPNLDVLARQVYAMIKNRLAVERERRNGLRF